MPEPTPWSVFLDSIRDFAACERPAARPPDATKEHTLAAPWPRVRLPEDMYQVVDSEVGEDDRRRIWYNVQGLRMDLRPLPVGMGATFVSALEKTPPPPTGVSEGLCARAFVDCAIVIQRTHVEIFEHKGWLGLAFLFARSGESVIVSIAAESVEDRERLLAPWYDVAEAGLRTPDPTRRTSGPRLMVRLHAERGDGRSDERSIDEQRPHDPQRVEQEIENCRRRYSGEAIANRKDVAAERARVYAQELEEYFEELRIFREGETEERHRSARTTMLPIVVENAGDVPARDVLVRLTFPATLIVGTIATLITPRIEAPEQPQLTGYGDRTRRRIERTVEVGNLDQAAKELGWESYERRADGSLVVTHRLSVLEPRSTPILTRPLVMFRDWSAIAPVTISCSVSAAGVEPTHVDLRLAVHVKTVAERQAEEEAQRIAWEGEKSGKRQRAIHTFEERGVPPIDLNFRSWDSVAQDSVTLDGRPVLALVLVRPPAVDREPSRRDVMEALKYDYPPLEQLRREGRVPPDATDDLLRRYEQERLEWAEDYVNAQAFDHEDWHRRARSVLLTPTLRNPMGVPLDHVRLRLWISVGPTVVRNDTIEIPPRGLQPPLSLAPGTEVTPPRVRFDGLPQLYEDRPRRGVTISALADGTTEVAYEERSLVSQGFPEGLTELRVKFAQWEDVRDFTVRYEIDADDMKTLHGEFMVRPAVRDAGN